MRPTQYVGSVTAVAADDFFVVRAAIEYVRNVPYVEGLLKLFSEVLDNAIDNSRVEDNPTNNITILSDGRTITISNDGRPVPVKMMDGGSELIPKVVFGQCLSGSNFTEARNSIGMNGLGVKLVNILSDEFSVDCRDACNRYRCTWTHGMAFTKDESISTSSSSGTTVTFTPTIKLFDRNPDLPVTSLAFMDQWFRTRVVQAAATHLRPVRFKYNGELYVGGDFKAYICRWGGDSMLYIKEEPGLEYGLIMSPTGQFEHQSFVNGTRTTSANSTHTRYVASQIAAIARDALNGGRVTTQLIQSKMMIFVSLHIKNPEFTSQTKVELSTPVHFKKSFDQKRILAALKRSGIIAQLQEAMALKVHSAMNGSKRGSVLVDNYDGAHRAGSKQSAKCTLFVVEGLSAKTMVTTGFSVIGREFYGVFPIRGKLINVRAATLDALKRNKEVQNLMKILGLHFDRTYDNAADLATLRYGKLCTLCDSDEDGHHITGLLLNFVLHYWPALVGQNFLHRFVTPIIKVTPGPIFFFNYKQYETWYQSISDRAKYFVKHLKGLGTSERADSVRYFTMLEQSHMKRFEGDPAILDRVFGPKNTDWRKSWISARAVDSVEYLDYDAPSVAIDEFVHSELFQFSRADILRSIPSAIDGFKKSQRQVFFGALQHFGVRNAPFKVAQLAAAVAAITKYAHGETSLQDTIVGMAQDFPGSNNLPLLAADGAFGSRMQNGKDAASARYIYTRLRDNARDIFRADDDCTLERLVEENQVVQPRFYVPTLPMLLINGASGIGTGFASELPCFKREDVAELVVRRLARVEAAAELMPYYEGYAANHLTTCEPARWAFHGMYEYEYPNLRITELPIGMSIDGYKESVLAPMLEKKLIRSYVVNHPNENQVRFDIVLNEPLPTDVRKMFKLTRYMTRKCMNFLDRSGRVKSYSHLTDIVDDWLQVKMQHMALRKAHMIQVTGEKLAALTDKRAFVTGVLDGAIRIFRRTREEIRLDMASVGIREDGLINMPLVALTRELVDQLDIEIRLQSKLIESTRDRSEREMFAADLSLVRRNPCKKSRLC